VIKQNTWDDRWIGTIQLQKPILKVAIQPTAGGGDTHFVTGNIRLVAAARDLLSNTACQLVIEDAWMIAHMVEFDKRGENQDEWHAWLEYKYNINDQWQGNIMEEQLLIEEQQMYSCPVCQKDNKL
jgi:hypothetical protein